MAAAEPTDVCWDCWNVADDLHQAEDPETLELHVDYLVEAATTLGHTECLANLGPAAPPTATNAAHDNADAHAAAAAINAERTRLFREWFDHWSATGRTPLQIINDAHAGVIPQPPQITGNPLQLRGPW